MADAATREIDPATGLWKLPDGHFFRIKRFNWSGPEYSLRVVVRRRRWFGSRALGSALSAATEKDILRAARWAMDRAEKKAQQRATRGPFLGDYPPKRLGGAGPKTTETHD